MKNRAIYFENLSKGSWVSEAWMKEHPEELEEEAEGPPKRIATAEERREQLGLDHDRLSAVCEVFGHDTSTQRSVDFGYLGKPDHRR